jgi:signal transduction histidine kinase
MNHALPTHTLRILHVEDSEIDHELIAAHLLRGGLKIQIRRVDTEEEFRRTLKFDWDIILSDYNLPDFSGLAALDIVKASGSILPFILISGEIGEDTAVAAMRKGASDYLLKNNLTRLVPALLNAVETHEALRAKQRADLELNRSQERVRELAQHLQTRIENERADIAREIHDDVGGSLTAVKFDIAWIERHAQDIAVKEHAQQALETINHAIEASQRVMHNLRPAILEQGLVAALQWMTQRFEKRTGIPTVFTRSHEQLQLPPGVPLVAYRAAQEALTNISKHARATKVQVDLTVAARVLSLEVSDNGRGLSQTDLAKQRSFGIRGLNERAATVGGWIDLSSSPTTGTSLILSVPLEFGAFHDSKSSRGAGRDPDDPTAWGGL